MRILRRVPPAILPLCSYIRLGASNLEFLGGFESGGARAIDRTVVGDWIVGSLTHGVRSFHWEARVAVFITINVI